VAGHHAGTGSAAKVLPAGRYSVMTFLADMADTVSTGPTCAVAREVPIVHP
jgi:hypothetical protein